MRTNPHRTCHTKRSLHHENDCDYEQQGGVGKTVTAINLADILIQDYRKRVLLADCDGQMNLTRFFLPEYDPEVGYSMVSLLLGDGEPVWSDNVVPLRPGLNLVPGSLELYSLDLAAMSEGEDVRQTQRMLDFAEAVRQDEEVDYLIFDCPPGFTAASMAALRAADEVVIPMELDGFRSMVFPRWRSSWPTCGGGARRRGSLVC